MLRVVSTIIASIGLCYPQSIFILVWFTPYRIFIKSDESYRKWNLFIRLRLHAAFPNLIAGEQSETKPLLPHMESSLFLHRNRHLRHVINPDKIPIPQLFHQRLKLFLRSLRFHDYRPVPLIFHPAGKSQILSEILRAIAEPDTLHASCKNIMLSDPLHLHSSGSRNVIYMFSSGIWLPNR